MLSTWEALKNSWGVMPRMKKANSLAPKYQNVSLVCCLSAGPFLCFCLLELTYVPERKGVISVCSKEVKAASVWYTVCKSGLCG